jgi:hypothetical protein
MKIETLVGFCRAIEKRPLTQGEIIRRTGVNHNFVKEVIAVLSKVGFIEEKKLPYRRKCGIGVEIVHVSQNKVVPLRVHYALTTAGRTFLHDADKLYSYFEGYDIT